MPNLTTGITTLGSAQGYGLLIFTLQYFEDLPKKKKKKKNTVSNSDKADCSSSR